MEQLLIIGARGFGREVYWTAMECIATGANFQVKGFLDSKSDALERFKNYPPIIDSVENYVVKEGDVFVCALGDTKAKKYYAEMIINKGGKFVTLIHPRASICPNSHIGNGCIIGINSLISCDTLIGDFVTVLGFCTVGHDATIGDWSYLGTHSFIGGEAVVEQGATLHTGSVILPQNQIGNGAVVGAGSIVVRNVPEQTTVHGNPAIRMQY